MGESDPVATCARKTVVVKYGGAAVERGRLLDGFLHDIAALRSAAIDLVVVHGGGPQISRLMEESGKTPPSSVACESPTTRPWSSSSGPCGRSTTRSRR
jgi:carbamate kinase